MMEGTFKTKQLYRPLRLQAENNMAGIREAFELSEEDFGTTEELFQFLNSSMFMRKSYNGQFAKMNSLLLEKKDSLKEGFAPNQSFKTLRTEMKDVFLMAAAGESWAQYKQVYKVDGDFAEALSEMDEIKMPANLLSTIPFNSFYVDLEEEERFAPLKGFFVCMTKEKETGLPFINLIRLVRVDGNEDDLCYCSYLIPNDYLKIADLKREDNGETIIVMKKSQFQKNEVRNVGTYEQMKGFKGFVDEKADAFVTFALQFIIYLASYKPDVRENRISQQTYRKEKKQSLSYAAVETWDVGIRYGTAIRSNKEHIRSETVKASSEGRKSPRCHIRSAHWHRYWIGEGRKELTVKWLPPTYVCGDRELPVTIHKVK